MVKPTSTAPDLVVTYALSRFLQGNTGLWRQHYGSYFSFSQHGSQAQLFTVLSANTLVLCNLMT